MPIYEYKCKTCGHQLEAIQKITDAALTLCPECKKESLEKLISAAGFQLKGTGWYVTDFKNKNNPTASTSKSPATETTPKSEDNKSSSSSSSTTKE